jgi:hypothetical protein
MSRHEPLENDCDVARDVKERIYLPIRNRIDCLMANQFACYAALATGTNSSFP